MKVIVKELQESIVCTLPNGEQLEVTMLCAEGDECFAEPSAEGAVKLLMTHFNIENQHN